MVPTSKGSVAMAAFQLKRSSTPSGRPGPDPLSLTGPEVETNQAASLGHGVPEVRVGGVDEGPESVPEPHLLPVVVPDSSVLPEVGGAPPGSVVLHASVDVEGDLRVHAHMVELPHRKVVDEPPMVTPGPG